MQNLLNSLPFFDWLADLWQAIITIIPNSIDILNGLIDRINVIEFDNVFAPVLHFLAVVRYLIGDVNYLLIMGTFYVSAGFLFYRLINKLIGLIKDIFENAGINKYVKIFKP